MGIQCSDSSNEKKNVFVFNSYDDGQSPKFQTIFLSIIMLMDTGSEVTGYDLEPSSYPISILSTRLGVTGRRGLVC